MGKLKVTSWLGAEVEVKVRVKPDGTVSGQLLKKDSQPSQVDLFTFNLGKEEKLDKCYFGVSGYSGSKSYIQLEIQEIETRNYDMTKAGEQVADAEYGEVAEWKQALEEEKRFVSQAS